MLLLITSLAAASPIEEASEALQRAWLARDAEALAAFCSPDLEPCANILDAWAESPATLGRHATSRDAAIFEMWVDLPPRHGVDFPPWPVAIGLELRDGRATITSLAVFGEAMGGRPLPAGVDLDAAENPVHAGAPKVLLRWLDVQNRKVKTRKSDHAACTEAAAQTHCLSSLGEPYVYVLATTEAKNDALRAELWKVAPLERPSPSWVMLRKVGDDWKIAERSRLP